MIVSINNFLFAQFNGSVQSSYQLGNQTDKAPSNKSDLYNQINIRYLQDDFSLGLRFESNLVDTPGEYNKVSQKYLHYNHNNFQLKVGNFYEILGRGLLVRSYEIPGAIFQDDAALQRYGFYKDIEGISLRYNDDLVSTKIFYGRPLDNFLPPASKKRMRRPNLLQGLEITLNYFEEFSPGILYLRSDMESRVNEYNGFNVQGNLYDQHQYYVEFVKDSRNRFTLDDASSHAFYGSFNTGYEFINASFEYKDYNNFTLGFNDPPPLVRENSYTLLNRATLSINPDNERGYQAEILFNIGDFNTITLNHSKTIDNTEVKSKEFIEYYADLNYYLDDNTIFKGFADYSQDGSKDTFDRYTLGGSIEFPFSDFWSSTFEVQYQQFGREYPFLPEINHDGQNVLLDLSVSHAPDLAFGPSVELSNDPLETDRLLKGDQDVFISWPAVNASYQYDHNNTISLFYGKRRGGNACTGGICYLVLPFEGLELRLNSRF